MLAVKHKKKETEGDSLLEGKHLSLLMVMENKEEKYGHSLLEGKCLLLWHRKMRNRRCTLSGGEVSVIVVIRLEKRAQH